MSVVARHDLTIHQGLVLVEPFRPQYKDTYTNTLLPVDYTGYTGTFTIYPAPATLESLHGAAPIYEATDANGVVNLGLFESDEFGEYGILLYLPQNVTSALSPWGVGIYNLDVIDPFGHPQLRIQGKIVLEEGSKNE